MVVETIVDAFVVGAVAGASATATTAVTDTYTGLKDAVRSLFRRRGGTSGIGQESRDNLDELFAAVEADPHGSRTMLMEALTAAQAEQDVELAAAAQRMLDLVAPGSIPGGTYHIGVVSNSSGLQFGNGNTMYVGDRPTTPPQSS